jgi:ABC-type glutathione transport system ATPase component
MHAVNHTPAPLLAVESLVMRYAPRGPGRANAAVKALDSLSFTVCGGTTLALVGASGAGKSTLALCLAGLQRPTAGKISFDGRELTALSETELRAVRPQIQLVFQDPSSSLNPRLSALEIVSEPLRVQRKFTAAERAVLAGRLFERVGLSFRMAARTAQEFSGGQRQRLAIGRALVLEPRVLILDEALSALDASVQSLIANLLSELQQSAGLTCILITHDFAMAARLADQIAVLDRGRIVEQGAPNDLVRQPAHAATRSLLAATPQWTRFPRSPASQ